MKHFPMFGLPALVLGGLLTTQPILALGGTVNLSGDLGSDFLFFSAQGYLGVGLASSTPPTVTGQSLNLLGQSKVPARSPTSTVSSAIQIQKMWWCTSIAWSRKLPGDLSTTPGYASCWC